VPIRDWLPTVADPMSLKVTRANQRTPETPPEVRTRPGVGGNVGVGPLRTIPVALRQCGVDPAAALKEAGLTLQALHNDANRISFPTAGRLLARCAELSGKPHFALLMGANFELSMLGPLGHLMRNEASVGAALRSLILRLHLHDGGAVPDLSALDAHRSGLSYSVYAPETPAHGLIEEYGITVGHRMLKSLCGPRWRPLEVRLAHAPPRETRPYRDLFEAPVRFNAAMSMIVFETRWLTEPVIGADPDLHRLLAGLFDALESQSPNSLTDRIRRVLRTAVLGGTANARSIAKLFSVSERTLRRHLSAEGFKLHELIAEARQLVAKQLIEESRLPLGDIAVALHYSDISALSRAFRGWTGLSPREWRRTHPSPHAAGRT
jgi:AraC-like DNA-binding protein